MPQVNKCSVMEGCFPGLNQYFLSNEVEGSCSRTPHRAPGEIRTHNTAKRASNQAVHQAEKVTLQKIDPKSADIYRLAKQMRRDNQDVMGEKPV